MSGKFIVFEGIDGCGKGTQMMLISKFLFDYSKEIDLYLTREPTRDFKEIRKKMASDTHVKQDPEWYAEMFVKDRKNHITNYIVPTLQKGTHVLCDRYKYSTLAYQWGQGMELSKLNEMHDGLLVPDLILVFDCPADVAYERRKNAGATDMFDKDVEFSKILRKNYIALKEKLSNENIIIIDATRTIAEIHEEVKKYILETIQSQSSSLETN